jgi:hypothetical protein
VWQINHLHCDSLDISLSILLPYRKVRLGTRDTRLQKPEYWRVYQVSSSLSITLLSFRFYTIPVVFSWYIYNTTAFLDHMPTPLFTHGALGQTHPCPKAPVFISMCHSSLYLMSHVESQEINLLTLFCVTVWRWQWIKHRSNILEQYSLY